MAALRGDLVDSSSQRGGTCAAESSGRISRLNCGNGEALRSPLR